MIMKHRIYFGIDKTFPVIIRRHEIDGSIALEARVRQKKNNRNKLSLNCYAYGNRNGNQ